MAEIKEKVAAAVAAVEEKKEKGLKAFAEKHPKLTKFMIGSGLVLTGAGIGYGVARATEEPVLVYTDDPAIFADISCELPAEPVATTEAE